MYFQNEQIENYITRTMLVNIIWSFSGDGKWKCRKVLSDFLCKAATVSLPPNEAVLFLFDRIYRFTSFSALNYRLQRIHSWRMGTVGEQSSFDGN